MAKLYENRKAVCKKRNEEALENKKAKGEAKKGCCNLEGLLIIRATCPVLLSTYLHMV